MILGAKMGRGASWTCILALSFVVGSACFQHTGMLGVCPGSRHGTGTAQSTGDLT